MDLHHLLSPANKGSVALAAALLVGAATAQVASSTPYGSNCGGLDLSVSSAPILGTILTYTVDGIQPSGLLNFVILGIGSINPGISLTSYGIPGCMLYVDLNQAGAAAVFGVPTALYSIQIPNSSVVLGLPLNAQGASIDPVPPGFAYTSNAIASVVGLTLPNPPVGMVSIAPGHFNMGQTAVVEPVHQVTISYPFWISRHEITQQEYTSLTGTNPSAFQSGAPLHRPVEQVSWHNAVAYCQLLTASERAAGRVPAGYEYRLATEAEWEYCCRAGTQSSYSTGGYLGTYQANYGWAVQMTSDVGTYAPNAWGLYDMHGNVREWVLDSHAGYPTGPVTDPFVTGGSTRILRGGCWSMPMFLCHSAFRIPFDPTAIENHNGFRIVLGPALIL